MRDSYLERCDFAKTILMLCVIIGHSCAFWTGSWFLAQVPLITNKPLGDFANWFGTFHTYGFTLISGYIYYYISYERGYGTTFIKKKVYRLIVPYVFVSILWVLPISNYFYDYTLEEVITGFLLGTSPAQLWFLLMLFNVFILFRWLKRKVKRTILFIIMVITLYVLGFIGQLLPYNYFQIFTSFHFLLFFTIGYYIRKHNKLIFNHEYLGLSKGGVILFLTTVHIVLYFVYLNVHELESLHGKLYARLIYMILNIEGSVSAFAALTYFGGVFNYRRSSFYLLLQKNNFVVYLLHQQIIYIIITMFNGVILPEIHAMMNCAISVVVSFVIAYLARKSDYTKFMLGEK